MIDYNKRDSLKVRFAKRWASIDPDTEWQNYYTFVNIQNALDEAIIEHSSDLNSGHVSLQVDIKPFPWKGYSLNLGALIAAGMFGTIFSMSFVSTVVLITRSIVLEKELQLKDGMMMMGLKGRVYWVTWFLTHYSLLIPTSILICLVGMYPFEYSSPLITLVFMLMWTASLIMFCYFLSTFFSRARVASMACAGIYMGSVGASIVARTSNPAGGPAWLGVCILPAGSMYMFGGVCVGLLENAQTGVRFDTLNDDLTSGAEITCAKIMGITFLDIFFYFLLTWYIGQVAPWKSGAREPFHFFLLPSYWRGHINREQAHSEATSASRKGPAWYDSVEPLDRTVPISVHVDGLTKKFGELTAVNNLSIDLHENSITALLGHNGAGKTTMVKMLTGMERPTHGIGTVGGLDISREMIAIRRSLGVCPQFDILWPHLTVQEHLQLYASFHGVKANDAELLAKTAEVGLEEKFHTQTMKLSGGQKRKLSLIISFLGQAKIIVLDEPSSGMDPFSRRQCWDMIRKNREGRTIMLTTHFMDEADILCDRIAILADGNLACYGSSVFLKNRFGHGYRIIIEKGKHFAPIPVTNVITKHIPEAELISNVGAELAYALPTARSQTYASLLREIEDRKDELQIAFFGMSCTTLEDVFLNVGRGTHIPDTNPQETERGALLGVGRVDDSLPVAADLLTGIQLAMSQCGAMIKKRVINMRRDRTFVLAQLLAPAVFTIFALLIARIQVRTPGSYDTVPVTRYLVDHKPFFLGVRETGEALHQEDAMSVLQEIDPAMYVNSMRGQLTPRACYCPLQLRRYTKGELCLDTQSPFCGGEFDPLVIFNSTAECVEISDVTVGEQCEPLVSLSMDSVLLDLQRAITPCNEEEGSCDALMIQSYNRTSLKYYHTLMGHQTAFHALPTIMSTINTAIYRSISGGIISATNHPLTDLQYGLSDQNSEQNMIVALLMVIAMSIISASYVTYLVWERSSNSKHLQMVSGVNKYLFWVCAFICDYAAYLISTCLLLIIFWAFQAEDFIYGESLGALVTLLLLFGLCAIPLTHLLSFVYKEETTAFASLMGAYFFFGLVTTIASVVLSLIEIPSVAKAYDVCKWVFRIFPHYCLGRGIFDISSTHQLKQHVEQVSNAMFGGMTHIKVPSIWEFDNMGGHITFLLVESFIALVLTMIVQQHEGRVRPGLPPHPNRENDDEDVAAETARIQEGATDLLTLSALGKTYGRKSSSKVAVFNLSVGIKEGQCFGLLGINGAGKTTTFKMITGEFLPSTGDIYVNTPGSSQLSIRKELNRCRQLMGYCPQFGGLQAKMTAREHLNLYAMIRGVAPGQRRAMVDSLLDKMDLTKYANRPSASLSGGNKRKLSVAIALVGNPPIVLLDEPSTGMDPEAKRFMWGVLSRSMAGRCLVLTSHSMEECEALCNRVAIMVNGRFSCIGSLQHLKARFGDGYQIDFRVAQADQIGRLKTFVEDKLLHTSLEQESGTSLTYKCKVRRLSEIFDTIEKGRAEGIFEDYSLSQTTLEHVFLRFASKQTDEDSQSLPGEYCRLSGWICAPLWRNRMIVAKAISCLVEGVYRDSTESTQSLQIVCPDGAYSGKFLISTIYSTTSIPQACVLGGHNFS
eukprot:scaffold1535_cov382-Prasinococcus_capsulatus_cf.AAC.24